jgi:hypothetical protein
MRKSPSPLPTSFNSCHTFMCTHISNEHPADTSAQDCRSEGQDCRLHRHHLRVGPEGYFASVTGSSIGG